MNTPVDARDWAVEPDGTTITRRPGDAACPYVAVLADSWSSEAAVLHLLPPGLVTSDGEPVSAVAARRDLAVGRLRDLPADDVRIREIVAIHTTLGAATRDLYRDLSAPPPATTADPAQQAAQ